MVPGDYRMDQSENVAFMTEIRSHEREIAALHVKLAELEQSRESRGPGSDTWGGLARYINFVSAQVIRHEISMALLQSRMRPIPASDS